MSKKNKRPARKPACPTANFTSNPFVIEGDLSGKLDSALEEMNSFQFAHPVPTNTPFNHNPFVTEVWVERQGWRFKDPYLVRLKDGTEIEGYPNGGGYSLSDNRIVEDDEVTHLKLLQNPDFRRAFTGARKLVRQFEYFGTKYPAWVEDRFVKEEDLPEGYRFEPTEVYAYRDKERGRITVMIARANIVEENSGAPRLLDILEYAKDPNFWWDKETQILNHDDVMRGIHYVHLAREHYKEDPEEAKWLDEFAAEHFGPKWICSRQAALVILKAKGKAQFVNETILSESIQIDESLISSKETKLRYAEAVNNIRGPKLADYRGRYFIDLLYTLQHPEEVPSYFKGL